jgi:hypothetical protein
MLHWYLFGNNRAQGGTKMTGAEMSDIQHLDSIDGAQFALQANGSRQTILVQVSETGQHLVRFLGLDPAALGTCTADEIRYWRVPHDARVDQFLKQLIDILISIRYLHPAFVQLQMELA